MRKSKPKPEKRRCNYELCRVEFTPEKNNPGQEYCSDKCWTKANKGAQ